MKPIELLVMRAEDMHRVHPQTDWSHSCSKCKAKVGIYPSGQAIIAEHGDRVTIVCNRCNENPQGTFARPAPGVIQELGETFSNPNVEGPHRLN